eukprot:Seg3053.3 transcript_id=Seg3053.3/GoldUCD/mRNA.D3Y31 product="hypothetical protein" protein_id=Seg3053.3/GoldUCD/D3Y31
MEAYVIMRDNNHISHQFEFSEELPFQEGVFSKFGKNRLHDKIDELLSHDKDFLSIYTCEPYSLIIGKLNRCLFILDTNKIKESLDGNGNAQLRAYNVDEPNSSHQLCIWIWRRLAESGVKGGAAQSLALLKKNEAEMPHVAKDAATNISATNISASFKHEDDSSHDSMKSSTKPAEIIDISDSSSDTEKMPLDTNDSITSISASFKHEDDSSHDSMKSSTKPAEIIDILDSSNEFEKYVFTGKEHEVTNTKAHGNSKGGAPYRRVMPSIREKMSDSGTANKERPKSLLDNLYTSVGDVIHARSASQLPRGPKDIYNARYVEKHKSSQKSKIPHARCANYDALWMLLEKAKRDKAEGKESVFIKECSVHPNLFVVLATDRQLMELEQFCTNPLEFTVFGADPTFNIFSESISLTVTTYRNLKLQNPATGKPPVFIGPLLMHQKKDVKTYSKFAFQLTTEKQSLEGILACGTDGEEALVEGFKRNFRFATFLRCTIHFKANIKAALSERGFAKKEMQMTLDEIFGKQEGDVKFYGLIDCDSEEEFDRKLQTLEEKWKTREEEGAAKVPKKKIFYDWFLEEKANVVKTAMLKPVREEAGLGNPPKEYTTNDNEAANFMLKNALEFDVKKPCEFIEEVRNIIEVQFRNEDRAVFNKGQYRISQQFKHFIIDDLKWSKLTSDQRIGHVKKFVKGGMEDRKNVIDDDIDEGATSQETQKGMSINAADSGITDVPLPIL